MAVALDGLELCSSSSAASSFIVEVVMSIGRRRGGGRRREGERGKMGKRGKTLTSQPSKNQHEELIR